MVVIATFEIYMAGKRMLSQQTQRLSWGALIKEVIDQTLISMENLTADEAEQYDRQIRLWGLDAQKRLRKSKVLVIGMSGLGSEVSKNIVLAGVSEVTLLDHTSLKKQDSACRFLMQTDGESRAEQAVQWLRTLNPNVTLVADVDQPANKPEEYFTKFDVIVATHCPNQQLIRLDEICRNSGIKFFCGDIWGYYGYFFTDLGEHDFVMEVKKAGSEGVVNVEGSSTVKKATDSEAEMVSVKETASFCSLQDALATNWSSKPAKYFRRTPPTFFIIRSLQKFRELEGRDPVGTEGDYAKLEELRVGVADSSRVAPSLVPADYSRWCNSELSPVCAIVGGVLGQEVIKAISAKDRPYKNCFLYDGRKSTGIVESLG